MKTAIRIIICVCLLAVAVTMAAFTLADLSRLGDGGAAERPAAGLLAETNPFASRIFRWLRCGIPTAR